MMNALVIYVGTPAIAYIHSKERTPSIGTIAHTVHMNIFQHLVVDLDIEGKTMVLARHQYILLFRSLPLP